MSRMRDPVLATERLRFHPWEPEDFPLLLDLHRDPEVQHFLQMGDPPWDEAFLRAKFDGFRADYASYGWTKFKVLDIHSNFLGRAGFGRFDETGELELGYSFMRPYWELGYATEAAGVLLEWVYGATTIDHVIGFAVAEHKASRRVLEKAGMRFTGLHDLHGVSNAFYRHDRLSFPQSGSERLA